MSEPRIGVIGVPGGWSTERLADAFEVRTGFRLVIDMARVVCDLASPSMSFEGHPLPALDACVIKKVGPTYSPDLLDRLDLLHHLSTLGPQIFSKPRSIMRLIDRLSCTLTLSRAGIPMPPTVITEDVEAAAEAVVRFGRAVAKPLYSSKARGMTVLSADDSDLLEQLRAYQSHGNTVIYLQKMLDMPDRDLGVAFLAGEYVGTYARVRTSDATWNTTTRAGGKYAAHEPSPAIIELAHRAQALFDLTFTSVDIVETEDGPFCFEVSAFGGFRGLLQGADIDAAALYADHVLAQIT